MKRNLIRLSLLLLIHIVNGQVGYPDSEAVWSVYKDKYFARGDSVINELSYDKFYRSNKPDLTDEKLFALLREEDDRIYAIKVGETDEKLLYDYSLQVDSSVTVFPIDDLFFGFEIVVTVLEKDSIYLNGEYRDRMKIGTEDGTPFFNEYWIEGIGSTFGLFSSGIQGQLIFDLVYPSLLCFERSGTLIYDNPDFETCYEVPVSLPLVKDIDKIKIFPNPTDQVLNIESNEKVVEVWITSISGQRIKHFRQLTNNFKIDLNTLKQGNYILVIRTQNEVQTRKIMKNGL